MWTPWRQMKSRHQEAEYPAAPWRSPQVWLYASGNPKLPCCCRDTTLGTSSALLQRQAGLVNIELYRVCRVWSMVWMIESCDWKAHAMLHIHRC